MGDKFEVEFIESKRYYEIDENGTVGDYQEIEKDPYPGDIISNGSNAGSICATVIPGSGSGKTGRITNCKNYTNVISGNNTDGKVGGIVGYCQTNPKICNCYNLGNVKAMRKCWRNSGKN